MTDAVVDRAGLAALAAAPIGGAHLMKQADLHGHIRTVDGKAAAKRAGKKWLPMGRKPRQTEAEAAHADALEAAQIDLEDAVEAAGGCRGGASQ